MILRKKGARSFLWADGQISEISRGLQCWRAPNEGLSLPFQPDFSVNQNICFCNLEVNADQAVHDWRGCLPPNQRRKGTDRSRFRRAQICGKSGSFSAVGGRRKRSSLGSQRHLPATASSPPEQIGRSTQHRPWARAVLAPITAPNRQSQTNIY